MSAQQHRDTLRYYFSDKNRFQWGKTLPSGGSGFLTCLQERHPTTGNVRKFVIKCAKDPNEPIRREGIRNETHWLQILKNAEHIIRILTISNNPLQPGQRTRAGFPQEYVILEYLEGGTLGAFLQRIGNRIIPNRILWRLFLCIVRACVAMAYPPAAGRREEVRDSVVPSTLAHFDMHNDNFMFGNLNANSLEHSLVPILKLIDFDLATDQEGEGEWPDEDVLEKFDNELEFRR
ncbi:hypothetical protein F4779DRAFT_632039 [Xylariaceae sp. FL0662B]|nr:hypothetical protein F4779DRAFT_632039 [Xylariaceae sp. FL0662B]